MARSIDRAMSTLSSHRNVRDVAVVTVPALAVGMLAYEESGRLMLVPIGTVADTHLVADVAVPAETAFAELAPLAKAALSQEVQ
jgi:hypothetical protein